MVCERACCVSVVMCVGPNAPAIQNAAHCARDRPARSSSRPRRGRRQCGDRDLGWHRNLATPLEYSAREGVAPGHPGNLGRSHGEPRLPSSQSGSSPFTLLLLVPSSRPPATQVCAFCISPLGAHSSPRPESPTLRCFGPMPPSGATPGPQEAKMPSFPSARGLRQAHPRQTAACLQDEWPERLGFGLLRVSLDKKALLTPAPTSIPDCEEERDLCHAQI